MLSGCPEKCKEITDENSKQILKNFQKWRHSHLLMRILLVGLISMAFIYGVGIGHYKWFPFGIIQESKTLLSKLLLVPFAEYMGEAELMGYGFTDPVAEVNLYYPPITDLSGILTANNRIFMQSKGFETAFDNLQVLGAEQLDRPKGSPDVVRVRFAYQEREYEAFAYGRLPEVCDDNGYASLIIPGSGLNQSLAISTGEKANTHYGILDALNFERKKGFILIKPNEDFLAWHDGKGRKLGGHFIWNWHLNRNGSYSVSYLVESLAFTKWLKGCYKKTLVAGLSQGGAAALLNALQSKPNQAVVASGFSIINDQAEWSGHNQLIGVPGYGKLSEPQYLVDRLQSTPTQFLFTWGSREYGAYKIEAEEQRTAKVIRELPNVTAFIHDGGHIFPNEAIKKFLVASDLNNN
jgi:hypothetical protein